MNWGHKITLVFIAFAVLMVSMVVRTFQENTDLVTEEYYLEELNYEQHLQKVHNAKNLEVPIRMHQEAGVLVLTYPDLPQVEGTILLYRPSDAALDRRFEVSLSPEKKQELSMLGLPAGRYLLKVDWKDADRAYFQEFKLNLP